MSFSIKNKNIFMDAAIQLSIKKMQEGCGGPFGAVIVQNGKIIAEGYNCVTTLNDPTAHAEIQAIRNACAKLKTFNLQGCEIYSSCEPCPMCLAALYWAHIDCIYFGCNRADAAKIGFDDEFLYQEIQKPIDQRKLPMVSLMRNEALRAFSLWSTKTDKTLY